MPLASTALAAATLLAVPIKRLSAAPPSFCATFRTIAPKSMVDEAKRDAERIEKDQLGFFTSPRGGTRLEIKTVNEIS